MAFDPLTTLTLAALLLAMMGALMIQSPRGTRDGTALRSWGVGFLMAASGIALILVSPPAMRSPTRIAGNALVMLAYGALWGATRDFGRQPVRWNVVVAGALVWIAVVVDVDPGLEWRIGLSSAAVGLYSVATGFEFRREGAGRVQPRTWSAWVFWAHGVFYLVRAVAGPTFDFMAWGENVARGWGAVLGLETMVFAATFGALAFAMSGERTAPMHRQEALEDNLTSIGNRRALFRSGEVLMADVAREGRPLALMMMDLDAFERVNARHGHDAGDRLLVAFARLAHDYLPPTSLVCRLGGEAFAAVLPGADAARARTVADDLRTLFSHLAIEGPGGPVATTVSIGIAQARPSGLDIGDVLERADRCLHAAKERGRNRVIHETELPPGDIRPAA